MNIPLASQDISELEINAVNEVLRSDRLSLGPNIEKFEQAICDYVGCKYAAGMNSGTSVLHVALMAAGVKAGDEVITSSYSFISSANVILHVGATPVFVDIDPDTWQMDTSKLEALITPKTKAIIPVHVFGQPTQMKPIMALAEKYNLKIIEDSCEAIGAKIDGQKVGTIGQSGAFAFYPNKQMTTGEGGILVTNDPEVARLAKSIRNQGRGEGATWLSHERLGYNFRMSEMNAAMGWAQVSRLDTFIAKRAQVAKWYTERLCNNTNLVLQKIEPNVDMSWFVYVVRLADHFADDKRAMVLSSLSENGIGCNAYFTPIHLQKFYRESFGHGEGELPVTEKIGARSFAIPFFNNLKEDQVDYVCDKLTSIVNKL